MQVNMVDIILVCRLEDSETEGNDPTTPKIYILKDLDGVNIPMLLGFKIAHDLTRFFPPSESLGSLLSSFR